MPGVTVSIRYAAPPSKVFAVLTDIPSVPSRIPAIKSVEMLAGAGRPFAVGTRWRETRVFFGKEASEVMWVTEVQPERMYRVEAESRGTHYDSWFRFTPDGDGTRVDVEFRGTPLTFAAKMMSGMMSVMAGTIRKCLLADLEALRPHVEGATGGA